MNNRSNAGGFPLSFAAPAAAAGGGRIHGSRRFYPDGRYRGATRDGEAWGGGNRGPPAASDGAIGRGDRRTKLRPPRNPGIFRRGRSSFSALSRRKERERGGAEATGRRRKIFWSGIKWWVQEPAVLPHSSGNIANRNIFSVVRAPSPRLIHP
ncbi:hypothetical protein NL676_009776 [Syzygium grande]|nr:hypothetical protein NL676_009776 [Syzygium grande]